MPDTPRYTRESLEAFLRAHGIPCSTHEHHPVFTVAEADTATGHLAGIATKNLFLRDDKGHRHILVVVPATTRVSLKLLGEKLGVKKLGFASPERLRDRLGVEPGSVTLFGLINDSERRVECIIDTTVWAADAIQCHPLTNTGTVVIRREEIGRFLELTGHQPRVVDIPEGE